MDYEELHFGCSLKIGDLIIMRKNMWESTNFPGEIKGLIVGITGEHGMYSDYIVLWQNGEIEHDLVADYLERYYEIYPSSLL